MDRLEAMRRRAEYDQYELQRLEDKEMRKGGTHTMEHFSKQHNEVPRMDEESSSDEEEKASSGFENLLPVAAVGAAGAVLGYRNRKTIRKGVKAVKSGAKAVGRAAKAGVGNIFGRIKARLGR